MTEWIFPVIVLGFVVAFFAGLWKSFEKAGLEGWKSVIPVYNIYLILKIGGLPGWLILVLLIPFVSFFVSIIIYYNFAKKFDKGTLFSLLTGLLPFIGVPIIGFDDSSYTGDYEP